MGLKCCLGLFVAEDVMCSGSSDSLFALLMQQVLVWRWASGERNIAERNVSSPAARPPSPKINLNTSDKFLKLPNFLPASLSNKVLLLCYIILYYIICGPG